MTALATLVATAGLLSVPAAGQTEFVAGVGQPTTAGPNPGFDAELVAMIMHKAGLQVRVRTFPDEQLLNALATGEIDIAIAAVGTLVGDRADIAFTQTAVLNTAAIVVSASVMDDVTALSELQDRAVGVQQNSTWHRQLIDEGINRIHPFPDFRSGMEALRAGDVDAYYTSRAVFLYAQHANGAYCDTKMIETYINTEFPLSNLAVRSGDTELLAALNQALSDLRSTGVLLGGTFHYHPNETHVAPLCVGAVAPPPDA